MKKQYKIQLPKGKKVTMTNVDFENGVMTVNVEFGNREEQKYKPKDGDFVYVRACYDYIAIFNKEVGDDMYVHANLNMSFSIPHIVMEDSIPLCRISDIRDIRPATEREKKILIDQLAKVNKKWNEETRTIEDVRWRADFEGTYYYIDLDCFNKVRSSYDAQNCTDNIRYHYGNYFKIREAAEKVAEQIRGIFKNSKEE